MKLLKLASFAIATVALLPSITSCSSDPNPFDVTINTGKEQAAYIRLNFNVEDTRAGGLSTTEENAIKKVNIYVFDEKQELETSKTNVAVSDGANSVVLEVSHGLKTIYVITSQSGVNPAKGTSITNFENLKLSSALDQLMTADGHVMIGRSDEQQVMISASQEDMPESNNFSIRLTRLVAKAQVKVSDIDGSSFGITLGSVSFKASQTCDRMMVVHNGSDIVSPFADSNNNGTYDNYSIRESAAYLPAVTTDFTASGCEYLPENIVNKPLSGNTTFLSVKVATTPKKYYSFTASDSAPQTMTETPSAGSTYYVVGIVDKEHGVSDYCVDSNSHIITFKNQEDAQRYMSSLNTGVVSSITVSQTDKQMKAPSVRAGESRTAQFEVFAFNKGDAYYRVNIAHEEKKGDSSKLVNKVVRNKYYKVNINSVKNLGFSSEALLRPTNPAAVLDAEGSSWIAASFTVADWDEVEQNVDL